MSPSKHFTRRQALSAGADAGAAVPLQPRLRRLRQDRLSRRDPEPAPLASSSAWPRSTSAARRWSPSPAASPCCTRTCRRSSRASSQRKKFVILCTNALLLTKKIDQFKPDPFFTWSIHLDGDQVMHDHSVCQDGVYDIARGGDQAGQVEGLPCQHQLHAVPRRRPGAGGAFLRRDEGDRRGRHHHLARLRL